MFECLIYEKPLTKVMRNHLSIAILSCLLCSSCILFKPASSVTNTETPSSKSNSNSSGSYSEVLQLAESLKGVPYKYGGTTKRGFDCSGFTSYVYERNAVEIPRTSRAQEDFMDRVSIKQLQPGDFVFFRPNKIGNVFHVALVVNNDRSGLTVIHATSSRGVVKENISQSSYWTKKYWTGGRLPRGAF